MPVSFQETSVWNYEDERQMWYVFYITCWSTGDVLYVIKILRNISGDIKTGENIHTHAWMYKSIFSNCFGYVKYTSYVGVALTAHCPTYPTHAIF
jgi:hypothetical protein